MADLQENLSFQIVSFINPKTGTLVKYAVNKEEKKIYEIQRLKRIPSSYFIDEEVKEGTPPQPFQLLPLFFFL
jgi:hypothetical protein